MSESTHITDLSAQLYVELQRLTGAISLYRSYYTMAGFIPKTHYSASHVNKQESYSAEQWLSDFFANKTGLIPSFLDMNQCVPPSPDAATKMLESFLEGLNPMPILTPREDESQIGLFDALRADIEAGEKSRKMRGTSSIYLTEKQKEIGIDLVDDIERYFQDAFITMTALRGAYEATAQQ